MSTTSRFSSSGAEGSKVTNEQRTTDAKRAFLETFASASATIDSELKERAINIHANAQALNNQRQGLDEDNKQAAKESEETSRWLDKHHKKLASFDDLIAQEGYIDDLHDEMDSLEAMLNSIEDKNKVGRS